MLYLILYDPPKEKLEELGLKEEDLELAKHQIVYRENERDAIEAARNLPGGYGRLFKEVLLQ